MDAYPYDVIITISLMALWLVFPIGLFISIYQQTNDEKIPIFVPLSPPLEVLNDKRMSEEYIDHYEDEDFDDYDQEVDEEKYAYDEYSHHHQRKEGGFIDSHHRR